MQLDAQSIIEVVGETLAEERNARVALEARLNELARLPGERGPPGTPAELTVVPDDIAEQVAKAIAVLKETSIPATLAIRSERGGRKGHRGERGPAGRDGAKGDEGPPGRDGISVAGAAINRDGDLTLTLSNGTTLTPGRIERRDA